MMLIARMKLAEKAKSLACQFAFYGHTHIAKYENIGGIHVINRVVFHNHEVI